MASLVSIGDVKIGFFITSIIRQHMSYCRDCGAEVVEDQSSCEECGAKLNNGGATAEDTAEDSFVEHYGAEPLPFAGGRSELISIYGKVLGSIPLLGVLFKKFVGFWFWCYSINLSLLNILTLGADVNKRLRADFNYLKDSFNSGFNGEERQYKGVE